MIAHLPVVRSAPARILFLVTAVVTIVALLWMRELREDVQLAGLTPIFFVLFAHFDYFAAMGLLLLLLMAVFVPTRPAWRSLLKQLGSHPGLVALAYTAVTCLGALFVYQNHPLSMDEYAPFLQSQAFATGRLTGQFPAPLLDWLIPKGFQNVFLNVSTATGAVVSSYWPSFALLLTPFTALGIPWACNPVLSGLSVLTMHRLAQHLFKDDESAGLAVLLTIASPVVFADGISYYSMTAHMLANMVFALLLFQPTTRRLLLAGGVGSIALTLHNPVPHLLFAVPWVFWLATRPGGIRNAALLFVGYLPLTLILGLGWFWYSSDLIHQGAAAMTDSSARIGSVFALPTGTVLLARLIGLVKVWLWSAPAIVLLACFGAWRSWQDARIRLLVASALLTLAGYVLVKADQGHGWGFRYFHSVWFALPLLAAAAFRPLQPSDPATSGEQEETRTFVVASALLSLVFFVGMRGYQIREFMHDHLSQLPRVTGAGPRILFIDPGYSFYGIDLVQNDPYLRGDRVRMLSHGPDANAALMRVLRPDYEKVFADFRGEVWAAEPSKP